MSASEKYDQVASDLRRPATMQEDGALDVNELIRYATLAASSHNTQPWKFHISEDSIAILPDYSRRCPMVDPDDSHLFKSLGCAAENLTHAAAAQGFSADVRFDPVEDGVMIKLHRDSAAHATDLYRAIPRRQCTKTPYDGSPLEQSALKALEDAGMSENVRTLLLLSQTQKETVIDYVNRGNSAQLTDRVFRRELASWIRFNPGAAMRTGDGLSGRALGNPAVPTWLAKLMLGLILTPKKQARTDADNIRSSAGVAVFVAGRNDKAAWVEAGRVYERFALQATALNICTAFINQPIEVHALRPQFESWLGLNKEHALLMVRFGYGPAAPFSLRRTLDDVIVDASTPTGK
jgi:hypothetical protein